MKEEMTLRFIRFAAMIVELGKLLNKTFEGRHIYQQLFRSGISVGANYEESHSAESTRDFIHKREIVQKELRESLYWIRLIMHTNLLSDVNQQLESIKKENEELIKIIAKSINSTKNNSTQRNIKA